MKHIAVIAGYEYRFIEMFSSVEDSSQFVLCANPDGKKFICPVDFWLSHTEAAASEPVAPINTGSTAQEKITFFLSLFRGRENLYAKRYYNLKTGKSGYVPACQNEWKPELCNKRAQKCPSAPTGLSCP